MRFGEWVERVTVPPTAPDIISPGGPTVPPPDAPTWSGFRQPPATAPPVVQPAPTVIVQPDVGLPRSAAQSYRPGTPFAGGSDRSGTINTLPFEWGPVPFDQPPVIGPGVGLDPESLARSKAPPRSVDMGALVGTRPAASGGLSMAVLAVAAVGILLLARG